MNAGASRQRAYRLAYGARTVTKRAVLGGASHANVFEANAITHSNTTLGTRAHNPQRVCTSKTSMHSHRARSPRGELAERARDCHAMTRRSRHSRDSAGFEPPFDHERTLVRGTIGLERCAFLPPRTFALEGMCDCRARKAISHLVCGLNEPLVVISWSPHGDRAVGIAKGK